LAGGLQNLALRVTAAEQLRLGAAREEGDGLRILKDTGQSCSEQMDSLVQKTAGYFLEGPGGKRRALSAEQVGVIAESTAKLLAVDRPVTLRVDVDPDRCVELLDRILASEQVSSGEDIRTAEALCLEHVLPRMRMTRFVSSALEGGGLGVECLYHVATVIAVDAHSRGDTKTAKEEMRSWNFRPQPAHAPCCPAPEEQSLTYIRSLGTDAVVERSGCVVMKVNSGSAESIVALIKAAYPSLSCDTDSMGAVSLVRVSGEEACLKVEACLHRSRLDQLESSISSGVASSTG
jgi:hypothetical protein